MSLFSERQGYVPAREKMQRESIDNRLRTALWNELYMAAIGEFDNVGFHDARSKWLATTLWRDFFNWPLESITYQKNDAFSRIKEFFNSCEWYIIFDLIDFLFSHDLLETKEAYSSSLNKILEKHVSAYRIVSFQVAEVTEESEIVSIEEALNFPLKSVRNHLLQASDLLFDRENPDFRNSIKESMCAVESLCKIIVQDDSATLGKALSIIEKEGKIKLHKALKTSFDKLYGYTSDADGIRHGLGLLQESNLDFEDAKYMLVSCSTFINFLVSKASKAGIELNTKE